MGALFVKLVRAGRGAEGYVSDGVVYINPTEILSVYERAGADDAVFVMLRHKALGCHETVGIEVMGDINDIMVAAEAAMEARARLGRP